MKHLFSYCAILLLLSNCGFVTRNPYNAMSDTEIAAYNTTVPRMQQIICIESANITTRIPRRECMTVQDYNNDALNDIGVLNAVNAGGLLQTE